MFAAAALARLAGGALGFLRTLPPWVWLIAACLVWGGWQRHRATALATTLHTQQAQAAAEREQQAMAALTETKERLIAQGEAVDQAQKQTAVVGAVAAQSAFVAERLRSQLAAVKARAAASHPAAATSSQTDQLADALGQCANRYRAVAEIADRAVIAGRACEASYEALEPLRPRALSR